MGNSVIVMIFDSTINAGQIGELAAIAVGAILFFAQMRSSQSATEKSQEVLVTRLGSLELEVKNLSRLLESNARLEERLVAQALRITALEVRAAIIAK